MSDFPGYDENFVTNHQAQDEAEQQHQLEGPSEPHSSRVR